MNQRRIAWALAAVSGACAVTDTVIPASFRSLFSRESVALHGWPLTQMATVGASVMGALIISRYPRHVIGWLLAAVGVLSSVSLVAETYDVWVLEHGGPGSDALGHWSGWLSLLLAAPLAFAAFTLMLLLAPDGKLISPRWRIVAVIAVVGLACWTIAVLLTRPHNVVIDDDPTGGSALTSFLFKTALWSLLGALVASVVSVLIRLRRSEAQTRLQLRWIALWATTLPTAIALLLVFSERGGGASEWLARMPLLVSYALLPICLAIAVMRYRLYNVDIIINRAVVLAGGTAFAAVGYVAVVVGVGALVGSRAGGYWTSLVATGAVAIAFQPARRRVVRTADRLAYGVRAAPYEALAAFSRQLGESPDPGLLLPSVAEAAAWAVSAQHVTVRLHVADCPDRTATWPAQSTGGGETTELPVVDHGEVLGSIAVRMPVGRALRPADESLLADLAAQTAIAFRNARLSTELAAHVDDLDRQTCQLALSRSRLIEVRDVESVRLEKAIRRDVISHVEHVPDRLTALSADAGRPDATAQLALMIDQSVAALEALRTLTRGIYSTQLERFGLASAISADVRRLGPDATFTADDEVGAQRFDHRIESAAYFCYVNAVPELPAPVNIELTLRHAALMVALRCRPMSPPDLRHLQDRLDPLDGSVTFTTTADRSVLVISVPGQRPRPLQASASASGPNPALLR